MFDDILFAFLADAGAVVRSSYINVGHPDILGKIAFRRTQPTHHHSRS